MNHEIYEKDQRGDAEQKNAENAERNMDEMKIEFLKVDFGKLELKAGDILVLKFKDHLYVYEKNRIYAGIKELLPEGVKCLIFDADLEIDVLSPEYGFPARAGLVRAEDEKISL